MKRNALQSFKQSKRPRVEEKGRLLYKRGQHELIEKKPFVLKRFTKGRDFGAELPELVVGKYVVHPNLVNFDSIVYKDKIIEAWMHQGRPLPEAQTLRFDDIIQEFWDVSCALKRMHEVGLLHLDVKPENIVVIDGVSKLIDFEYSQPSGTKTSAFGTPGYLRQINPKTLAAPRQASPNDDVHQLLVTFLVRLLRSATGLGIKTIQLPKGVEFIVNDAPMNWLSVIESKQITPTQRLLLFRLKTALDTVLGHNVSVDNIRQFLMQYLQLTVDACPPVQVNAKLQKIIRDMQHQDLKWEDWEERIATELAKNANANARGNNQTLKAIAARVLVDMMIEPNSDSGSDSGSDSDSN